MCANREHRYRVEIKSMGKEISLVTYARGISEAIAKADAWAFEQFGDEFIHFKIHHAGYSSYESAKEHGAIFPEDGMPEDYPHEYCW